MNSLILGFNGERMDSASGATHLGNGYRAYNPEQMRFNCPDNLSPFGAGGINPYAYCAGDPVNRTDPSGHFSLGQGIGMALGFVAGIALSILAEGAAMPAVVSLVATMAGDAAIGAGAELVTEAVDGRRINGGQVGLAAGIGAAGGLIGYGAANVVSKACKAMIKLLSRPINNLRDGYVPEQVAFWDRVATRNLGKGRLSGGTRMNSAGRAHNAIDIFTARERELLNTYEFTTEKYNGILYRGDITTPDIILEKGFRSKGVNGDWWSHVNYNKNSHFISFSKNKTMAAEFVKKIASLKGLIEKDQIMPFGYIYEIENLDYAIDISRTSSMEEVVGVSYVPASHIKGVYGVNIDDETGAFIFCYEENPGHLA